MYNHFFDVLCNFSIKLWKIKGVATDTRIVLTAENRWNVWNRWDKIWLVVTPSRKTLSVKFIVFVLSFFYDFYFTLSIESIVNFSIKYKLSEESIFFFVFCSVSEHNIQREINCYDNWFSKQDLILYHVLITTITKQSHILLVLSDTSTLYIPNNSVVLMKA